LAGAPPESNKAYWLWNGAALELLMRDGVQAPGLAQGITLTHGAASFDLLTISDNEEVILTLKLSGPTINDSNDDVMVRASPTGLSIVAREGDHAPGLAQDIQWFPTQRLIAPNGRIVLQANLAGPGITSSNSRGLWLIDGPGEPQLVLRLGDLVEVAPGDSRVLTGISLFTPGDHVGGRSQFNRSGQIPLTLIFGQTFGVFVLDVDGAEPCLPDINHSGAVHVDDLIAVILSWGCMNPPGPCPADVNKSGGVDVDDLIAVILAWGACP